MTIRIIKIKAFMIVLSFLVIRTSFVASETDTGVSFDPFGSDSAEITISRSKSDFGPIIPQIEFNNNDISMVFQIISDATGWSIFPTVNVSKAKISLWAKNVSVSQLLDTVVTMAGFVYYREGDVITVMTYEEYMRHHGLAKKVFTLEFAAATSVDAAIKPFMTKLGKSVVHKETNTIVLYETDANLEFIAIVIEKLDTPSENIIVEVINLKYVDCEKLAEILRSVFSSRKQNARNKSLAKINDKDDTKEHASDIESVSTPEDQIQIYAVNHANQLVVVGISADIEKVKNLVSVLDIYSDNMMFEVFDLKYADSEMLAETLKQLFAEDKSENQSTKTGGEMSPTIGSNMKITDVQMSATDNLLSPQSKVYVQAIGRTNQLIVKAFRTDLEKVKKFVQKLDIYVEPVTKNYQLTYVDATEIFTGLEKILNLDMRSTGSMSRNTGSRRNEKNQGLTLIEKTNSILLTGPPSAHRIMSSIVEKLDEPSAYETGMIKIYKLENADVEEVAKTISELIQTDTQKEENASQIKFTDRPESNSEAPSSSDTSQSREFVPQIEAKVSVSKSTNSIVVQATARQHRELEKLIKELDVRRRQVLIEAMIVEITNTDNLNLGVELSHVSADVLAFTDFGLSTSLDPTTGARDITVSPGGTAAVLQPDKVKIILQTLKQDGRARITSVPRILVNDNAVGFINSIAEEPTTQVNQGETTTTTSFGGFVEAGTQFAITPHISENDYLRVEYQITLNSFGIKPTLPSVPPPRNTTSIQSEATVPDGYTIVVGGLQTTDESENVDKVPLLGDIPILGSVFKNTDIEKQYKTTYLFVTPVIMESEDFADLRDVSIKAMEEAESSGGERDEHYGKEQNDD